MDKFEELRKAINGRIMHLEEAIKTEKYPSTMKRIPKNILGQYSGEKEGLKEVLMMMDQIDQWEREELERIELARHFSDGIEKFHEAAKPIG